MSETMSAEEIRRRRIAGEIACAECKRQKSKCDKQIPCTACKKRGASSICPEGTLPGSEQRINLASPALLNKKLHKMECRLKDLEAALEEAQSRVSSATHPLLTEVEDDKDATVIIPKDVSPDELQRAVGTLSITPRPGTKWYGTTAVAENFLENEYTSGTQSPLDLPRDIIFLSTCSTFLNLQGQIPSIIPRLRKMLPPREVAWSLVENHFERIDTIFSVLPRDRFIKQIWQPLYDVPARIGPEQLALMFIVLACGVLSDLDRPPQDPEGDRLFHLARAAMAVHCTVYMPTVATVQILFMLSYYMQQSSRTTGTEETWLCMGAAIKVAQSIALHRDSANSTLSTEDVELRRRVFWEMYCFDTWTAMGFGRPALMQDAVIDCQIPSFPEEVDANGQYSPSFFRTKHEFTVKYLIPLTQQTLSAKGPTITYDFILDLDKNIRDQYTVPQHMHIGAGPHSGYGRSTDVLTMQRYMSFLVRQFVILYIHRSFSSRAAAEMPLDPVQHQYGPSVLATYKCATTITTAVSEILTLQPAWTRRLSFINSYLFSAAVTLGTLIIFAPRWNHAAKALMELDKVCELFDANETTQARRFLPYIMKLRDKARASYRHRHIDPKAQGDDIEFADRLAGHASVLHSTKQEPGARSPAFQQAHPAIVGYLEELSKPPTVATPHVEAKWESDPGDFQPLSPDAFVGAPPSHALQESWAFYMKRLGVAMGG